MANSEIFRHNSKLGNDFIQAGLRLQGIRLRIRKNTWWT